MSSFLAALLLALVPHTQVVTDRVDVIELNHFYDEQGRLILEQVIFYAWSPDYERYDVLAWRLVKQGAPPPERDWPHAGYVVLWQDGELIRCVRAASFRETWTQHDPELAEREVLPKEQRRGLSR